MNIFTKKFFLGNIHYTKVKNFPTSLTVKIKKMLFKNVKMNIKLLSAFFSHQYWVFKKIFFVNDNKVCLSIKSPCVCVLKAKIFVRKPTLTGINILYFFH